MDLVQLLDNFRIARDVDVARLVEIANADPRTVHVRSLPDDLMTLADIADGPFLLEEEGGCAVMVGTDKETGTPAKIRIVGETVQVINATFTSWTEVGWGNVRIYVPR